MKISQSFPALASIVLGALVALPAIAQNATDGQFHDELLDRLVGHWEIVAIAHGRPPDPGILEAEWVMNHQYLRVHQKSQANVPGINTPYEGDFFIGYDHTN